MTAAQKTVRRLGAFVEVARYLRWITSEYPARPVDALGRDPEAAQSGCMPFTNSPVGNYLVKYRRSPPRETPMLQMVGGCLCGKVRYTAEADPVFTAVCHCRNCQKQAGTSFSVVVAIPASALSMTGSLKTFEDVGDSGKPVHRNFCPDCGSPITTLVDAMPGLALIKAGTLDDSSWLKPTMEVYCDRVQPWITHVGDLQKFARMPG